MGTGLNRRQFLQSLSLASLALWLGGSSHSGATQGVRAQSSTDPNVLILVFDALSAAHMSLYGYPRETTPNLARFAERATVYHRHYAAGNFTSPGTASLLTGTYPWSHRALHLGARALPEYAHRNLFRELADGPYYRIAYTHNHFADFLLTQFREGLDLYLSPEDITLFNERLTTSLFSNDTYLAHTALEDFVLDEADTPGSLFLSKIASVAMHALGRVQTRDYAALFPLGLPRTHGKLDYLLEEAIDKIQDLLLTTHRPFLGYFHLYPPHFPYNTRREFVGRFDDGWTPVAKSPHFFSDGLSDEYLNGLRQEYDEFIAYADAEFGRLYNFMEQTGAMDNTYLIVTSDHGELFERGVWEHLTPLLYEPIVRVPLIISYPGQRATENVLAPTSAVDLMPTLLQFAAKPIPDWCEGQVLPPFNGSKASDGRHIFCVEGKINGRRQPLTKGTIALVTDQHKLVHYFGYDGYENGYELYDVVDDPDELQDLYPAGGSLAATLQQALEDKLRTVNEGAPT